jgi:hypothetical protein
MAESFNRVVTCTIDNAAVGKKVEVKDLRITFNVTKTAKSSENTATIQIYNLAQPTRDLFQTRTSEGESLTRVVLRAGFQTSEQKILFRGTGEIVSAHKPPNWVTTITAEDSVKELKAVYFEKKYPAGTAIQDIVKDLVKAAGLNIVVEVPLLVALPLARVFSGDPIKNIEDLASTYRFTFNMQNEGAIIAPIDRKPKKRYLVLLSKSTGMLGRPTIRGPLLIVNALIDADLQPNNFVELVTGEPGLSGIYLIQKAKYQGDSWGGRYAVELEMTPAPPTDARLDVVTSEVFA